MKCTKVIIGIVVSIVFMMNTISCTKKKAVELDNLLEKGNLMFAPNEEDPFSGIAFKLDYKGDKVFEVTYKEGKREGKWKRWYETRSEEGELEIYLSETGFFKNDEENGKYYMFYIDGEKYEENNCIDGWYTGLSTKWYKNGQKMSEGNYEYNGESGTWTYWWKNGEKSMEGSYWCEKKPGQYASSFATGTWTYWDESGNKFAIGVFQNDSKLVKYTFFYEDGQKHAEGYTESFLDPNYSIKNQGFYRIGEWTFWSPDGKDSTDIRFSYSDEWYDVWYNDDNSPIDGNFQSWCNGLDWWEPEEVGIYKNEVIIK